LREFRSAGGVADVGSLMSWASTARAEWCPKKNGTSPL
jgi:hypothetical protein